MPNQAVPLRSAQANGLGNRSSLAMARDVSVTIRVQPLSAPMPEMTATAAMNLPGPGAVGEDRLEGVHERRARVDQGVMGDQADHRRGHQHVEDGAGRGADHRGPPDV